MTNFGTEDLRVTTRIADQNDFIVLEAYGKVSVDCYESAGL